MGYSASRTAEAFTSQQGAIHTYHIAIQRAAQETSDHEAEEGLGRAEHEEREGHPGEADEEHRLATDPVRDSAPPATPVSGVSSIRAHNEKQGVRAHATTLRKVENANADSTRPA